MTSKAALCKALLDGRTINIKNGFQLLGITNVPREIGRAVERSFGVKVSRVQKEGVSRYGQDCIWVNYKLEKTPENAAGIQKMRDYVSIEIASLNPKTTKQEKELKKAGVISDEAENNLQNFFN